MDNEPLGPMEAEIARVGTRLRRLRKERGWRLEDLAERTGLSRAYLSRLESGERQPSLSALFGVAQAYGLSFSALFEPERGPESGVVVREVETPMRRGKGLLYANLSEGNLKFNLQPLKVLIPAERDRREVYQHEGEQWLYVLSGRLELKIGDEEGLELGAGDAAHFDADNPHTLTALGGEDAEIIMVACAVPYLLLKSYL